MSDYYQTLPIGSILIREKGGIFSRHYGLVAGHDHFGNTLVAENKIGYGVRTISINQFKSEGKLVDVQTKNYSDHDQSIIQARVRAKLGKKYNLLFYNCEHFVNDVLNGVAKSKQIKNGLTIAAAIIMIIVGFVLAKRKKLI